MQKEQNDTVLRSYKMVSDRGFAPNPYEGFLTLATCKPGIRKCHEVGHWLAGFTSKKLNGDEIGKEKLVYLAKIDDTFPMEEYYEKYPQKRTCPRADNIYEIQNGVWKIVNKAIHNESHQEKDLSGKNVLVAKQYYYFGKNALDIQEVREKIRMPPGQSSYGWLTTGKAAADFIEWVKKEAEKISPQGGMLGDPHGCPEIQVVPGKDTSLTASCGHLGIQFSQKGCS